MQSYSPGKTRELEWPGEEWGAARRGVSNFTHISVTVTLHGPQFPLG